MRLLASPGTGWPWPFRAQPSPGRLCCNRSTVAAALPVRSLGRPRAPSQPPLPTARRHGAALERRRRHAARVGPLRGPYADPTLEPPDLHFRLDQRLTPRSSIPAGPMYTVHGHEGAVGACAFAPAGDFFASASADLQVRSRRDPPASTGSLPGPNAGADPTLVIPCPPPPRVSPALLCRSTCGAPTLTTTSTCTTPPPAPSAAPPRPRRCA